MATISIDKFETATVDEWGEAFGLIALEPGTTAYELVTDDYVFAIGFSEEWGDDGAWVCQIDDSEGGNVACWDGETPEQALENAAVQCFGAQALRENDNAEDATNQMAYSAWGMLNDCQTPDTPEEFEKLDRMLGFASEVVKAHGPFYGIEWEPYQLCEA